MGESYTYPGSKNERTRNCVNLRSPTSKINSLCIYKMKKRSRGSDNAFYSTLSFWFFIMIELVSKSRCIQCNICVKVCPTNVFNKVPDAPPTIARQSDCQTCFMCELYCPVDALYVSPDVEPLTEINEQSLAEAQLLGSYRKNIGWGKSLTTTAKQDSTYQLLQKIK